MDSQIYIVSTSAPYKRPCHPFASLTSLSQFESLNQ